MAGATDDTGSEHSASWSFAKFHMVVHFAMQHVYLGSTLNISCQGGDHAHKAMVKFADTLTNAHNGWYLQLLNWHTRAAAVDLMREESDDDDASAETGGRTLTSDPDSESMGMRYPALVAAKYKTDGRVMTIKGGGRAGCRNGKEVSRAPARVFNVRFVGSS